MKKSKVIILIGLLILGVFVLTGCGSVTETTKDINYPSIHLKNESQNNNYNSNGYVQKVTEETKNITTTPILLQKQQQSNKFNSNEVIEQTTKKITSEQNEYPSKDIQLTGEDFINSFLRGDKISQNNLE